MALHFFSVHVMWHVFESSTVNADLASSISHCDGGIAQDVPRGGFCNGVCVREEKTWPGRGGRLCLVGVVDLCRKDPLGLHSILKEKCVKRLDQKTRRDQTRSLDSTASRKENVWEKKGGRRERDLYLTRQVITHICLFAMTAWPQANHVE